MDGGVRAPMQFQEEQLIGGPQMTPFQEEMLRQRVMAQQ
jgi:hypothetical protein